MVLKSTSIVRVVDVLCEGPIQELVGMKKGVYLNETPVEDSSSTPEDRKYNFTETIEKPGEYPKEANIELHFREGGRTQPEIQFLNQNDIDDIDSQTVIAVGKEIGENYSETTDENNEVIDRNYGGGQVIQALTDQYIDNIKLTFTIPSLFSRAKEGLAKGQLFNAIIRLFVYTRTSGQSWKQVWSKDIEGISVGEYQIQTPWINISSDLPYEVKVEKKVEGEDDFEIKYTDFTDETLKKQPLAVDRGNRVFLTSISEKIHNHINYNHTAVVGIGLPSRTFPQIPNRAYKIKGLLVPTPHNANVRDDGSLDFPTNANFNGQLVDRWTTCPVCIFYALCTNKTWGAGDFIAESSLNWVDLYPLARYANQLVTTPDGTEPRFAINTVIGSQNSAHNLIRDLASIFRGMIFWSSNTIQVAADHGNLDGTDVSPVHLYSNSSVIGGLFNYAGSSLKTRSTSVKVQYNDPENFYKPNFVIVEDQSLIDKYGYQIKNITAFGCSSKWAARRLGRWMMKVEELDQEVVSFSVGLEGVAVFPGQVFEIADTLRAGSRLSGRIATGATTTAITLDQTAPTSGNLSCVLPDGTVETQTISSGSGNVATTAAFTQAPQAQAVWTSTTSTIFNQKFKCLAVDEQGDGTYTITASQFNDSIYEAVDDLSNETKIEEDPISFFNTHPEPPTNLNWSFSQVRINNNTVNRITWSWDRGLSGATTVFLVAVKGGSNQNNWVVTETNASTFDIDNLNPGTSLGFGIAAKWPLNNRISQPTYQFITVPFPTATGGSSDVTVEVPLPPDPYQVAIHPTSNDEGNLMWSVPASWGGNISDLTVIIRHSSKTDGTGTWSDSTLLREVEANTNYAVLPLINGEYLVKFKDKNGGKSANAVSAIINIADAIPRLLQSTRREDQDSPPFSGQWDKVYYSDAFDGLVLDSTFTLDQWAVLISYMTSWDWIGALHQEGTYYFNNYVDLGGKFSVIFKRILATRGLFPQDTFDDRYWEIDYWNDFDGTLADETDADIYFRISDVAPTVGDFDTEDNDHLLLEDGDKLEQELNTTFGEWIKMEKGRYTGRVFQFKCVLSSASKDQTPIIDELGYELLFDSRTESNAFSSGAGAKPVTYTNAFYQTPKLTITASNMATGDYYTITSESRTGFTIHFYNSSGASQDRDFGYVANGYGAEES